MKIEVRTLKADVEAHEMAKEITEESGQKLYVFVSDRIKEFYAKWKKDV